MNVSDVVTVAAYCKTHGLDYKRVRRMLRKNELPTFGAFRIGDARGWFVHMDESAPVLPDARPRGASRDDGRQRFDVWCSPIELVTVTDIVGDANVVNPRIAARNRRLARKMTAAETQRQFTLAAETAGGE